ncbi:MAG TPA: ABC transporter ATP-binding protein [Chthoniobacteraceae bacterium]|nr:ABC transporter ATP-binding protein [Chthoniobacteraceae bacterium]
MTTPSSTTPAAPRAGATIHLEARDLRRSFTIGKRRIDVLRGVSVSVLEGESVFLVGSSGAGKTTLLYTLAGLERPDAGEVFFEGRSLYAQGATAQARVRNERMGFIFQGYFLLPELTALENVMVPTMIRRSADRQRASDILERVGLADRRHHLPKELSGGEQQRVAIARALINGPSVIFADEPTGNLDSRTGGTIIDLLLALVRENQKTLLVVTHDARLAERGDRKIEMMDGCLRGEA